MTDFIDNGKMLDRWVDLQAQFDGEPQPIEQLPGCEEVANHWGAYLLFQRFWPQEQWHGCLPLNWLTENRAVSGEFLAQWLGKSGAPDWRRAVFLDTETSGLRPGLGTAVFLVGIGWLGEGFHLKQVLMRRLEEERACLKAISEILENAELLVTFNGRSFDIPMLAARYSFAGMAFPRLPPHIDLLALARSRWRRRLPSCSLASLEFHILRVEREQDVPGHFVPSLYQGYQSTGDGRLLLPILEHNAIDILSMVTLAGHLCNDNEE